MLGANSGKLSIMPLRKGSSDDVISKNIGQLIREGYDRKQAAAIAYRMAGRGMSLEARAALDVPLRGWASAMLGGRGAEVRVPPAALETGYTCGPAALLAALGAFGIGQEEDDLAALAGTSAAGGTSIWGLKRAAEEASEGRVQAETWQDMTLRGLVACLARGEVVLACIQAGDDAEQYDASHWVVPCVVTTEGDGVVELMDPSVEGVRSVCSASEFMRRWHCVDMGKAVTGLALTLRGESPANMTAISSAKSPL